MVSSHDRPGSLGGFMRDFRLDTPLALAHHERHLIVQIHQGQACRRSLEQGQRGRDARSMRMSQSIATGHGWR